MISRSKINNGYFGPRAIFDPNYIPPQVLFRKKEEKTLFSLIKDSISDNFSLNILYQGIQGIGKKVIINKVLNEISTDQKKTVPFYKISVDCKDKTLEELIFNLITELNKFANFNLKFDSIIISNISHLWKILKIVSKKINHNLFLIFNNIEYLKPNFFKKFLNLGKELNFSIISTVNKILRGNTLDFLSEFDIKKKLNYYNYHELNSILQTRATLTFSHPIDKDLIEFITDLIFEHYVPVPGKGIDIFREIYPFLKENHTMEQYKMLEICQHQFDTYHIEDEFNLLNYISEEDILTIIFIDNLTNIFLKKSKYYIKLTELKELYDVSCESLDYDKHLDEFNHLIKSILRIGILSPSKKHLINRKQRLKNDSLESDYYFMVINPYQLKAMVDAIFGNV
ncbi:MAG: hypothetical protein EU542_03920 [Promethearchaeota archaeon]|nr:MAG: hypothetical protein EU542_03920 [Candidatus Lokiarchaeota archaeon]